MGTRFGGRNVWLRRSELFKSVRNRGTRFCSNGKSPTNESSIKNGDKEVDGSALTHYDSYRDLDKLDFMTATKILFTTPPKTKKFGLDFHLVQLFFVCLPSLAVYLVAQYARSEMRKMDAELERIRQAEEAKKLELKAAEMEAAKSDPQLLEVKERLDKLEAAVKGIVVVSKTQSGGSISDKQEDKKEQATTPSRIENMAKPSSSAVDVSHDEHPPEQGQSSPGSR